MFALPDDKTSKIRTHWMDADGSHEWGYCPSPAKGVGYGVDGLQGYRVLLFLAVICLLPSLFALICLALICVRSSVRFQ